MGEITSYYDSFQDKQIIPFINKQIELNKTELIDLIEEEMQSLISLDVDYERMNHLKILKPKFKGFNITSIRLDSKYAEVTIITELLVSYYVIPDPIDIDRYAFEDNYKPQKISENIQIPCDIEVGLKSENDIKLKWINTNKKIRIQAE